jgi:hypothetical protein
MVYQDMMMSLCYVLVRSHCVMFWSEVIEFCFCLNDSKCIYCTWVGLYLTMRFYFCSPEVTMKDSDYGSDDLIGTQQVDLDDLDVDTEITKVLKVNQV